MFFYRLEQEYVKCYICHVRGIPSMPVSCIDQLLFFW